MDDICRLVDIKSHAMAAEEFIPNEDAAAARMALDRLLASETFRASPQLAAFLRFVVEAVLRGESSRIKGYTIGVEAFGRPENFDPQIDPIVRVEATRLRRTLERYYAGPGRGRPDRVRDDARQLRAGDPPADMEASAGPPRSVADLLRGLLRNRLVLVPRPRWWLWYRGRGGHCRCAAMRCAAQRRHESCRLPASTAHCAPGNGMPTLLIRTRRSS